MKDYLIINHRYINIDRCYTQNGHMRMVERLFARTIL